jgi:hypothetical protein
MLKQNDQALVNVRVLQAAFAQRGFDERRMGSWISAVSWAEDRHTPLLEPMQSPALTLSSRFQKDSSETDKIVAFLDSVFSEMKTKVNKEERESGPLLYVYSGPGVASRELMEVVLRKMSDYRPPSPSSTLHHGPYGSSPQPT